MPTLHFEIFMKKESFFDDKKAFFGEIIRPVNDQNQNGGHFT
jgi:hypothetical protein